MTAASPAKRPLWTCPTCRKRDEGDIDEELLALAREARAVGDQEVGRALARER